MQRKKNDQGGGEVVCVVGCDAAARSWVVLVARVPRFQAVCLLKAASRERPDPLQGLSP